MLSEIGYSVAGVAAGIGGVAIMFRFLNVKIEKKQDKALCENIAKNFNDGMKKGEKRFDKIMEILGDLQVSNGKIEQELKHFNGIT
jgi:formiminotetrahydrofolate cyclodeaminase